MDHACRRFRDRLEDALLGRPERVRTQPLAWHEHLLGCAACRALLAAEDALEELLATLPEPHLPTGLAARVLARLALEGARRVPPAELELDRLLELDRGELAPPALATRVLAGLGPQRGRRELEPARAGGDLELDRLLELVPSPQVPAGLSSRLLDRLAPARRRPRFELLRGGARRTWSIAAAAVLVASLGVGLWRAFFGAPPVEPERLVLEVPGEAAEDRAEPELLDALDVLENWELLVSEDLDSLLGSIDPLSIDYGSGAQDASAPGSSAPGDRSDAAETKGTDHG
jgi:hypothetical protein